MVMSNRREHLLRLMISLRESGSCLTRWEFSPVDELRLFEFIHPSVNTRDTAFRLFNLPVEWDVGESCLVDEFGKRMPLSPDTSIPQNNDARVLYPDVAPEQQRVAQAILDRGGKVAWQFGCAIEQGRNWM